MEEKIRLAVFGQKRLSREGGIEIVVKELCTRMAQNGCDITCYNRAGHHVSGAEYDKTIEYDGIRQKVVPTIEKKGLAAVSSSFFAALCSAFGRYDVVHADGLRSFSCESAFIFIRRIEADEIMMCLDFIIILIFMVLCIEHFTLYIKKFRFTIYAIQQNIPAEHPVSICIQQRFLQDLIVLIFQIVECRTVVCAFTCDVF